MPNHNIQFRATVGTNPVVEYEIFDGLIPSGKINRVISPYASTSVIGNSIRINGVNIPAETYRFDQILDAGGVPFADVNAANAYLTVLFSDYITGSRGAGGGGGGGDASAANQVIGNAFLQNIDTNLTNFVDFEKTTKDYICIVTGLAATAGEILRKREYNVVNQATGTNTATIEWYNVTLGAIMATAPLESEYVEYSSNSVAIDNQVIVLSGIDNSIGVAMREVRTYQTDGTYTSIYQYFDGSILGWIDYTPDPLDLKYTDVIINDIKITLDNFYNAFGNLATPINTDPSISAPLIGYIKGLLQNQNDFKVALKSRIDYIAIMDGFEILKDDILRRYEFTLVNQITGVETSVIEWRNLTQGASLLTALPSEDEYVAYVKAVGTSNLANQRIVLSGWDTDLAQNFNETRTYDALGVYTSAFQTFDGTTWSSYAPTAGALVYDATSIYAIEASTASLNINVGTQSSPIQTDPTIDASLISYIKGLLQESTQSKLARVQNSADYVQTFTYHNPLVIGSNVTSILHEGTTVLGVESVTQTFTYVDVAVIGSNVLTITLS